MKYKAKVAQTVITYMDITIDADSYEEAKDSIFEQHEYGFFDQLFEKSDDEKYVFEIIELEEKKGKTK